MRASQIAVRAALICSAAGIVCALWSAVDDTPARAADRDPGLLPAAADTAALVDAPVRTVEHTIPHLAELTEAAPTPVRKAAEPVERILDTVADTVQPTTRTPPPAAQPKPPRAPATKPAPEAVPAVVLLTGAAPSTVTVDPTRVAAAAPAAATALQCGDPADEATPPRTGHKAAPGGGSCSPDGSDTTTGLAQMKPPTQTGADQLAATTPAGPAILALRLLGELLPRSDLPTGRTAPPEPGPA